MKGIKKRIVSFLFVLLLTIGLPAGCGSSGNALTIIDNDFAEMKLFTQMARIMLEEYTDIKVKVQNPMAFNFAFDEISKGNMDMMMSYDGSLLTTYLHRDPSEVPNGMTLYDYANQLGQEEAGVRLLEKLGHQNTYAIAVTQEVAAKYQLNTISDLAKVSGELRFAAEHEFFDEVGTKHFKPFTQFYGIQFKEANSIDRGLKYVGMSSGNMDVTLVYGSDGLNKKFNLKVLKDDRHFFPEYYGAYLVRKDLFDDFPEAEEVLNRLAGLFDEETCIDLNYQIDVEEKDPYDVAYAFLVEKGLITK